jgi:hypothetical protein
VSEVRTPRRRRRRHHGEALPAVTVRPTFTLEQLTSLWETIRSDPSPYYVSDYTPTHLGTLLGQLGQTVILLMGFVGDEMAGGLFLTREEGFPETRKPLHCIVDLYVLEPFRGRAALALTRAWQAYLLETLRFPTFYCMVHPDHKACHALLRTMGMYRVGIVPGYLPRRGIAEDVILYSMKHPDERTER